MQDWSTSLDPTGQEGRSGTPKASDLLVTWSQRGPVRRAKTLGVTDMIYMIQCALITNFYKLWY